MTLAAENQKQTFALLGVLGYDVVFRRPATSGGTYDVDTSTVTGGANSDESALGAFVAYRAIDIDGTLVQRGDRRFLMSALYGGAELSKTPQIDDEIRGEGDAVRVVAVQTIKGGGAVIGYVLQVRE